MFVTDQTIGPAVLARELEHRGFYSLYVAEHTHIPVSRQTPYPAGGELPQVYARMLDPFVALATAAAVVEKLHVGTSVCLVAQRDPIVLAKAVASLDHVSGGRFTFGVGMGWNKEEAADHGVAWSRRRELTRERIQLMQALWRDEVATFVGEQARLSSSWAWPKPVQRPWPRILIGGAARPATFSAIADWADGWMPIGGSGLDEALPALRRAFEAAGRDPVDVQVVAVGVHGTRSKLERLAALGVSEVALQLPPAGESRVLKALDAYEKLLAP
ncbi:MAG: TIGR03619 family F420-dependent LLM class oxidoreductase [Mycobacterium sp.]|uniref:TIGR03619 family F420-dependent LLM class oxidoreductase n=1 Tax=Mycobacterium sp. TaxID=1785 RepID=UPI003C36233B